MISRKKGICRECPDDGKDRWLANNRLRLCDYHNKKRKVENKKQKNIDKGEETTLAEFYNKVWESRPHKSFLTGTPLLEDKESSFWINQFAHVLPKGLSMYPKFKFYEKNIILLTAYEHTLLDFASENQRMMYQMLMRESGVQCDWEKIYTLRETLKQEYNEQLEKN